MAITISGTDGIVGAGFTVDNSGVSVTAGVGTFSSIRGEHHGDGANLTGLPAAQLTGALPALSAASLTSIPAANIVGLATAGFERTGGFGGITMAEIWRITSEYSSNSGNTVYPTSWERDDNNRAGNIGASGMSQSSGVFTFPSTGIYQVTWQGYGRAANNSGSTLNAQGIHATGNNSSYSTVSIMYYTCPNLSLYNYAWGETKAIIDVTDTSNVKVKLSNYSANYMTWEAGTDTNYNCATFIRLGDT